MQHSRVAESMAGETENWGAHAKPGTMCSSSGRPLKYAVRMVLTLPRGGVRAWHAGIWSPGKRNSQTRGLGCMPGAGVSFPT